MARVRVGRLLLPWALFVAGVLSVSLAGPGESSAEEMTTTSSAVSTSSPGTSTPPASTTVPASTTTVRSTTTTTIVRLRDVRVIKRVRTNKRVVFITIDDGGYISPSLVRYLNRERIPITSFVMPGPLQWQWYKMRNIRLMRYGDHSNTHAHLRRLTLWGQKVEICWGKRLVQRITHKKVVLFRPPGGDYNADTLRAMAHCGIRYLILWNAIADHQLIRMRSSHKLMPGDIILMHYKSDLEHSLRHVMAQLKHDGLRPAFLNDYLKYG